MMIYFRLPSVFAEPFVQNRSTSFTLKRTFCTQYGLVTSVLYVRLYQVNEHLLNLMIFMICPLLPVITCVCVGGGGGGRKKLAGKPPK